MSVWLVVWVVLMMFWLCAAGSYAYRAPAANFPEFWAGHVIPWAAVLILGLVLFGALPSR